MRAPHDGRTMDAHSHLLVVATNYVETTGGLEGHLQRLLPLLVERGVAVTIAYLGTARAPYTDAGVHVHPLARKLDFRDIMALPSPQEWRAFERTVRAGELAAGPVTHVSTQTRFFPTSWLGMKLGRSLGVPVVHTEHGGGYVATSSRAVEAAAKAVDLTMGRAVLRGATRVLAVSRASCDFVQRLAGVPATQFNNGVDLARWLPDADAPAPAGERALVFVGRLVAEKGWRTFLDVARAARDAGFAGPIVLLGDGAEIDQARQTAADLGLGDAQLPGRVSADVVRGHLRGGILVNPTTASEGFQLTLVEAMAAGAGIVSYAVGGTDEVQRVPGADVAVVPLGDAAGLTRATLAMLGRPASAPESAALAQWDWAQVADAYVRVLAEAPRPR